MGFTKPSKIQETALPALLNDPPQNLIAQSQSGTGKTAAFALAMLSRIDTANAYPQAVCLAPTMELAMQTYDVVTAMGQFMPELRIALAIRGNHVPRNQELKEQLIIGTPGTLFDWSCPRINCFSLKKVKAFVLDEADVMIDQQGHQDICIRIVKLVSSCIRKSTFFLDFGWMNEHSTKFNSEIPINLDVKSAFNVKICLGLSRIFLRFASFTFYRISFSSVKKTVLVQIGFLMQND
jgi:ATP-dependent RNA helicase DDX19/DBP5